MGKVDDNPVGTETSSVLLLRWVLILGTSYLLLFDRSPETTPPLVGLFVVSYLASNLVAIVLFRRVRRKRLVEMGFALLDAVAVSLALLLREGASSDFFVAYFLVMLVATATDRVGLVAISAVVIAGLHLFSEARALGGVDRLSAGQFLRVPFLFSVSLFFGHLVQRSRSAERTAEEAREHERLRREFVAGVIHDLKNPLAVIQGFAEILLAPETSGALSDEQAEYVRRIHANAQHMTRLSLNLLNATRIEAGDLVLDRQPARLGNVIEDALAIVRSAAELKRVTLRFERRDGGIPEIEIDVIQMQRVIWNLVDNAIRYSPGGGTVVVSLESADGSALLRVADQGRGIAEEDLGRLFEQYGRTRRGQFTSSGLGLFIVKAIVEAHGGTVEVVSAVPGGTTFTIRLPLPAATPASASSTEGEPASSAEATALSA
jgi:signal transduction histidine kinase